MRLPQKLNLRNLLLTIVAASGAGCAGASAASADKDRTASTSPNFNPGFCPQSSYKHLLSPQEMDYFAAAAKERLSLDYNLVTDETTVCGEPVHLTYSTNPNNDEVCLYLPRSFVPALEELAIQRFLQREVQRVTGETIISPSADFSYDSIHPVSKPSFGTYQIETDTGSIYAAQRPVLVSVPSPNLEVVCIQAVKLVGEIEFYGCAYPITPQECDRRAEEYKQGLNEPTLPPALPKLAPNPNAEDRPKASPYGP